MFGIAAQPDQKWIPSFERMTQIKKKWIPSSEGMTVDLWLTVVLLLTVDLWLTGVCGWRWSWCWQQALEWPSGALQTT